MKTAFFVALALAFFTGTTTATADDLRQAVESWRAANEPSIVGQLDALTRFKSIAADPAGITAAADALKRELSSRGFDAELLTTPNAAPVVYGALVVPGAKRTVVFYAHYDGQPVTPSQWSSDPFEPIMRSGPLGPDMLAIDWKKATPPFDPEWRLFGRAVADDKTSIIAFLSAFDALKALGRKPSVNIKVVWEGEEEASSAHLAGILHANASKLASDLWLIGDAPVHQSRRPTLYFGARGMVSLEMTIYGPVRAAHDGHYGNWIPNPAVMAARLIAELRDDDGRILIPGFADDVRPLTDAESATLARIPPTEDELKRQFGIARSEGSDSVFASVMRPALNIRGIRAGQVGAEAASAIPVEATVSADFRLVPDQTVDGVRAKLENFLRAKGWTVLADTPDMATRLAHARIMKLTWHEGYPALRSDMRSPAAQAVIAAMDAAAGQKVVVLPMMGASVPIYLFADLFKVPVIGLPVVNHDDNQHAANENIRLRNLWDGIDTYAALMGKLDW
jgi:acetylornithine deacetylase/succinyl-diaminopimelate desuccinylase-like protein